MFSINTTGFDKLQDALAKYSQSVTENVKDIIAKSANEIAEAAKANTTDEIGNSITTETSGDGLSATITANSAQAVATEYSIETEKPPHPLQRRGTGKTVPHPEHKKVHHNIPKPFLNPAFEENRQNIIDSIAQTLQQQ